MAASQYPSADSVEFNPIDELSPDQEYVHGWDAQHRRLWRAFWGSVGVNVLLVVVIFAILAKIRLEPIYLTLDGAYPTTISPERVVIDGRVYVPARLRSVVRSFVETRFAYDWQAPTRPRLSLRYLSQELVAAEQARLSNEALASKIYQPQVKVTLDLDYNQMKVNPLGDGKFDITLTGTMTKTDRNSIEAGQSPVVRPVTFKLSVATVEPTDTNPDGYVITSIPEDIL